jgi:hypothetical protein
MFERLEIPAGSALGRTIRQACFPTWKGRRPIHVEQAESLQIMDFWDGGSRDYTVFLDLATMRVVSSQTIPPGLRQKAGNPYTLVIAKVPIPPGIAIVQHVISCGKDAGLRVYVNPADSPRLTTGPLALPA